MTTTDDKLALGRQIAYDPTLKGGMIGDPPRPLTNVEMEAYTAYQRAQREHAAPAMPAVDQALEVLRDNLERGAKARQLLAVVLQMRAAQREYFEDRRREKLIAAKQLEAKVDAGLEELRRK